MGSQYSTFTSTDSNTGDMPKREQKISEFKRIPVNTESQSKLKLTAILYFIFCAKEYKTIYFAFVYGGNKEHITKHLHCLKLDYRRNQLNLLIISYVCFTLVLSRKYRHTSYRQLARWCWCYLGKVEVRVPLPAYTVTKIRETFPSEDAEYRGFIDI